MSNLFRNRWWVVVASFCGLLVGSGSINIIAAGVFLKPVTQGLGISRGAFSFATMLNAWTSALSFPILGWMLDRWGTRRIMIPGIIICSLTTASYFFLPNSSVAWIYLLFAFSGFVYGCQSPVPYARVIAQWFDQDRGLALGIMGIGVGLGNVLIPSLGAFWIAKYGWRFAYIALAGCVLLIGLLPVSVFLREPPVFLSRLGARSPGQSSPVNGEDFSAAFRCKEFWALTLAFFLAGMAIQGVTTQMVAMLTDRGVSILAATAAYSAAGLTVIFSRPFSGWCVDHFSGRFVAILFTLFAMAGIAILLVANTGTLAGIASLLMGMALGAEFSLLPFFVSRYFGLKAYGKIYGTIFTAFAIGVGLGIGISGRAYDVLHGYGAILIVYEVLLAISCLLYLLLGPYPYASPRKVTSVPAPVRAQ